jgi:predicted CXXCH cytochrome family protein
MKKIARYALLSAALATIAVISNAPAANAEEPFCYECHDALPSVTHPHDPVESQDCTACHEDHGDAEELRLVEEGSALCYQCHDEFSGTGSMHPPVEDGECTECHNPHGSQNPGLLANVGAELCYSCHDEFSGTGSMHPPVEDGECTECHSPHGSKHGSLLAATGAELCYSCHDAMDEGVSVHSPVGDGECTECHSPHGSEHGSLLVAAGGELCFACHDGAGFNDPVSHAALDDGCTECHSPHNSQNEKLLTAKLSLERLDMFSEEQAELCFNCHDAEAFTAVKTEDTDFRHGQTNLHQLHLTGGAKPNKYGLVKKKAGQTCLGCHLPHSTLQARLLRTEFECKGIFCYTMRFKPNEVGGTCVVGCHKPRTYSRNASQESSTAQARSASSLNTGSTR